MVAVVVPAKGFDGLLEGETSTLGKIFDIGVQLFVDLFHGDAA